MSNGFSVSHAAHTDGQMRRNY